MRPRLLTAGTSAAAAALLWLAPCAQAATTALARVDASPDVVVELAPLLVSDHAVVAQEVGGPAVLVDLGALPEATAVTAFHRESSLSVLFAIDLPAQLGGLAISSRDVVRRSAGGGYELAFDGAAAGVPDGARVDAVTRTGVDLLLSFDVQVGELAPEDLALWDGASLTPIFDGSVAGVPAGADLDAAYLLESTGHLFLSFDAGGAVAGIVFADDDVLEYDPGSGIWLGVAWRGADASGAWPAADLDALGVVPADTVAPSNPNSFTSTSHDPAGWSPDDVIAFTWDGAADDATGAGLDGYSLLLDHRAATTPDEAIEHAHQLPGPQLFSTAHLADGDDWYLHLRTCDLAGNCAVALHRGPYQIDSRAPSSVGNLHSTSHTPGQPSADAVVAMAWDPASDATSGLAGYAGRFLGHGHATCPDGINLNPAATTTSSAPLGDGSWWFHICARDLAGNAGLPLVAGPYVVETTPPTVARVNTVAGTSDAELTAGEETALPVVQLGVMFSEPMDDPPGATSPGDLNNPDSYRLIEAGIDGIVTTTDCGAPAGDDQRHLIAWIELDQPPNTAHLFFDGGAPLPSGRYRLIVCAPGGVHDLAGNQLDGDGNGIGGDPFLLDFSVTADQLTVAPTLDEELSEWVVAGAGVQWSDFDAGGWPTSGSAAVADSVDPVQTLGQCVPADESTVYHLAGRTAILAGTSTAPSVWAEAAFFSSTDCGAGALGNAVTVPIVGFDPGLQWQDFGRNVRSLAGTRSIRVRFLVDQGAAPDSEVALDDLQLRRPVPLFEDGFEAGDFSAWTLVSP